MKELAARIRYADKTVPMCTNQMAPRYSFSGQRPHPNIQIPRNVLFRKRFGHLSPEDRKGMANALDSSIGLLCGDNTGKLRVKIDPSRD